MKTAYPVSPGNKGSGHRVVAKVAGLGVGGWLPDKWYQLFSSCPVRPSYRYNAEPVVGSPTSHSPP